MMHRPSRTRHGGLAARRRVTGTARHRRRGLLRLSRPIAPAFPKNRGVRMTDVSAAAAHFATDDFRVGSVISRSGAVLSRHFLTFFIVAVIAYSPTLFIKNMETTETIEP